MSRPVWSWIQSVVPASGELLRDLDVVASVGDVQGAAHVVWRASRVGGRLITGYAFDTVADVLRHALRGQLAAPPRQRSSPSTGDRIASPASCVSGSLSATDSQCRCPAQLVTVRRWVRRGWERGWGTALEGPTAARSDHRTFRRRRARAGPLTRLHSGRMDAITSSCPCSITSGGSMPLSVRPDVAVQRREERRGPGRARTPRHR